VSSITATTWAGQTLNYGSGTLQVVGSNLVITYTMTQDFKSADVIAYQFYKSEAAFQATIVNNKGDCSRAPVGQLGRTYTYTQSRYAQFSTPLSDLAPQTCTMQPIYLVSHQNVVSALVGWLTCPCLVVLRP
jgi:hypothetical protein